jgi:hypothetical protein
VNSKDGSTTAIYIDDTPIPTDPGSSFGREYPMLLDLERVEVLRGRRSRPIHHRATEPDELRRLRK